MKKPMAMLIFTVACSAVAQESTPTAAVEPSAAASLAPQDPAKSWEVARLKIPWTGPSGEGLALGMSVGSWGGAMATGIRARVPLHHAFGLQLQVLTLARTGEQAENNGRLDVGGRLEFYGASPVFLNLVRIYGGGGISVFYPVIGVPTAHPMIGGGGHFGFEFFNSEHFAYYLEVGGNSGSMGAFGSGPTIMTGMHFYL